MGGPLAGTCGHSSLEVTSLPWAPAVTLASHRTSLTLPVAAQELSVCHGARDEIVLSSARLPPPAASGRTGLRLRLLVSAHSTRQDAEVGLCNKHRVQ